MSERPDRLIGGLAAIFAHPDDESFGCAGALALAHDAGRVTRLLVATRGEAGGPEPEEEPAPGYGDMRERELVRAAQTIGLDEVTILEGYADGGLAEAPFSDLVNDVAAWLVSRRPDAVITFGSHGITGHPDHIIIGSATRWAVERLAEEGTAPHAIYVVSPVFGPGPRRYDLSGEEQGATHRIDITAVAQRKIAALECHASQTDTGEEIAALRAAVESGATIYEGYTRVRPSVPAPHPKFDARLW
jgi:LmbE family N-acetylglucosaminyl deacetylase